MTLTPSKPVLTSLPRWDDPEPAWDVARLFPAQGQWSVQEYLDLSGNRLVEFSNGTVEVLPMATTTHQILVAYLYTAMLQFVTSGQHGRLLFAPLRIRLWDTKFRMPDLVFMRAENAPRIGNEFWDAADLVVEVVSDDDRRRDLDTKRFEYARAGIPEYWVVDPLYERITVLKLEGHRYAVHGEFPRGQSADSVLPPGLVVSVDAVFDAARAGA